MADENLVFPVQADLRYLFPLRAGQKIAVYNGSEFLCSALENDGLDVALTALETLETGSQDCLFLAPPFEKKLVAIAMEIVRILKPGGIVLFCFKNTQSVKRFKDNFWGRSTDSFSLGFVYRVFRRAGLQVEAVYGLHDNILEPRFIVPLNNLELPTYFFSTVLTPYSKISSPLYELAPILVRIGLKEFLFADLGILACAV